MTSYKSTCRICGSRRLRRFAKKNGFELERCQTCHLVQVADNLSGLSLDEIYGREFFNDEYTWVHSERGRRSEYKKSDSRLQEIERLRPGGGAILDVGCSFGFFLNVARSRGWHSIGIDIGEYAADFARRNLDLEVYTSDVKSAPLPDGYFDAITMWNVVEHLLDPLGDFKRVNELLKKGGLVVFTTGDVGSYMAKLFGRKWRMFIPPIHVVNFHMRSVEALLASTGFSLLLKTVALPKEPLLARLKLLGILRKLEFSDKMLVFARKEHDLQSHHEHSGGAHGDYRLQNRREHR